jgi:hypothetical protein
VTLKLADPKSGTEKGTIVVRVTAQNNAQAGAGALRIARDSVLDRGILHSVEAADLPLTINDALVKTVSSVPASVSTLESVVSRLATFSKIIDEVSKV